MSPEATSMVMPSALACCTVARQSVIKIRSYNSQPEPKLKLSTGASFSAITQSAASHASGANTYTMVALGATAPAHSISRSASSTSMAPPNSVGLSGTNTVWRFGGPRLNLLRNAVMSLVEMAAWPATAIFCPVPSMPWLYSRVTS